MLHLIIRSFVGLRDSGIVAVDSTGSVGPETGETFIKELRCNADICAIAAYEAFHADITLTNFSRGGDL